jgi:hypothetical protein
MMKIGEDFPKLSWQLFNFRLLEPNAFIGDLIISIIALYFGFKIQKLYKKFGYKFHFYWFLFFLINSLTFMMGGLGHLLYDYWGIKGKYFAWFTGLFSMFTLEMAILTVLSKGVDFAKYFSFLKLITTLIALIITVNIVNLEINPLLGLIIPFIHSFLGMTYYCGYQSLRLSKEHYKAFIFCFYAYLLVFPILIIQSMKISPFQWFDRNDLSHILLIISLILFYKTASKTLSFKSNDRKN